ncbi:MAG: type 2 isopentenyl-diphosphate Delta-isomerase [Candidatus Micrarchaeota archaeon]
MAKIEDRKDAHIVICEGKDVQYLQPAGFSDVEFVHNALPEMRLADADCSCKFLGKKLDAPILITGMTGGTKKAGEINRRLAKAAQERGVALGLGSCRPLLEDKEKFASYNVRDLCPQIPLLANLGAVQIKQYSTSQISDMVERLGADALAIHLNSLQEAIQPEGETDFSGVLATISKLCGGLSVPVIVKETGAGINSSVAIRLFEAGVEYVEVSGRGGTSWSKVEYERGGRLEGFEEWGFAAVPAIAEVATVGKCIGSGGVRSGVDAAKAIALGADMAGAAMPFLRAKDAGGEIEKWKEQIRTCMFLCGAKSISQLRGAPILIGGQSSAIMQMRGINPANYAQREIGREKTEGGKSHYI